MKNIIHTVLVLSLLIVVITEVLAAPPAAYEGRKLYVSHCQICHGIGGKGDGPLAKTMQIEPADLTIIVRSRNDDILMKNIIGEDRETAKGHDRHDLLSDAMPKWKEVFSEPQIEALVAYLRFLGTSKHELMGDPEVGLQLYEKYCQICHGVEGDGRGIMTNLMGIKPMDHTNPYKNNMLDNEALVRSILDGKGKYMPAWSGILTQNDTEALVSYIRLLPQIWERLQNGGLVILMSHAAVEEEKINGNSLLRDPLCKNELKLSDNGKKQAAQTGKLLSSRGISINSVLASPYCRTVNTGKIAFGQVEPAEFLSILESVPEQQADAYTEQLTQKIGSYSGKGNLILVTHESNINAITWLFETVEERLLVVLMPMGGNEFEEIGIINLESRMGDQ